MKFSLKLMGVVVTIALVLCMAASVFAADVSAFADFPSGSWSEPALKSGVANGLIQGKDGGRIAPKDYITRAETATIINRAFGATVKADISKYTDVSSDKWYYAEMQKAVNMQTVQGVSATELQPDGYITREQVFTILARALVITDTYENKLMAFSDGASVSSWARGYTAALVNRGYVNGDDKNRLEPKDYITREEFAQVMYNIFKQYINGYNSVLSDATLGTTVVRTPNLTLKNLVINGDLIIADGVGSGNLNLDNVKVSGRILFRGGEGKVKLTNTTVGEFVRIHDVNGVVNFQNYEDEAVFKNHIQDTKATFLKKTAGGGGGSGGSGGGPTEPDKDEYTISFDGKKYFVTEGGTLGDAKAKDGTKLSDAIANYKPEAGYTNKGFKDETTGKAIDLNAKASGNAVIKPIDELTVLYAIYNANGGTMKGVSVYKDEANPFNKLTSYTLLTDIPTWTGEGDYTFAGWYTDKTTQQIVTFIPAGQVADVTLYAKWERSGDSVLGFTFVKNEDEKTVTVKVVLSNLPKNIDDLAAISVYYTQSPKNMAFVSAKPVFEGTFFNYTDGAIAWANEKDPITLEELLRENGELFEIVYKYTLPTAGNVVLEYTKETELASSTYKVASDYDKQSVTIPFDISYTVETYIQKVTDAPDADPRTYDKTEHEEPYAFDADVTYKPDEKTGFAVDESASELKGKNDGNLVIKVYYNRNKYTVEFNGNKYDFLYGQKLFKGTELGAALKAYAQEQKDLGHEISYTYGDGSALDPDSDDVITGEVTIKIADEATVYTITYKTNGGSLDGTQKTTYTADDKDYTLPIPTRENHIFEGWYESEDFSGGEVKVLDTADKENKTYYAKWSEIVDEPDIFTVTFYDGTTDNKGSIEVEEGSYVTKTQVEQKLGSPEDYRTQKGYTNSDGVVHEIYPELWYNDGTKWKIFEPEKVRIIKDTDVYLLTRYVAAYYDTDLEFRGIKLPQKEIVIPYDSNTDLWDSAMDTLTATRDIIASTLYDVESQIGVDLFAEMLEKASKTGVVDKDGNILNPEVPVPLHKLLTEKLIMEQIDNYIDSNINNEEFIAEILRNDTVVDMLLEDEGIRNKVLSDESMRNKLLTDSVIKEMISKDSVIDWIFNSTDFKQKFIDSDETFEYIIGDIKELITNDDYHKLIIDACVEFVMDVYFEETKQSDALVNYIDSVLDSDSFIKQIEENKELRPLFKEEIKSLIAELSAKPSTDPTKKEIYNQIRTNATIKQSIIDSVINNEDIMAKLREEVRDDLKKPASESKYRALVVEVIEAEFNNSQSTLKADIIQSIKDDLAYDTDDDPATVSSLKADLVAAVKTDLSYDTDDDPATVSSLKADLVAAVKTDLSYDTDDDATTVSSLKASVITAVQGEFEKTQSDIKDKVIDTIKGEFQKAQSDFKDEVIAAVQTDFNSVNSILKDKVIAAVELDFENGGGLKNEIIAKVEADVNTPGSSLRTSILSELSNPASDVAGKVKDYVQNDTGTIKNQIFDMAKDNAQNSAIKTAAKSWIETNIANVKDDIRLTAFGNADALKIIILQSGITTDGDVAYDYADKYIKGKLDLTIKTNIDTEANIIFNDDYSLIPMINGNFDTFYAASVDTLFDRFYSDAAVFNAAYESFISIPNKLEETFDNYITSGNISDAVDAFISADGKLEEAIDEYVKDPANLTKAINLYVEDPDRLAEAVDFYVSDAGRLKTAIDFYIEDATRLEEAIDFYIEDDGRLTSAIDTYIANASDTDIEDAIKTYIESEDNLVSAVNKYIEDNNKLIEIFDVVKGNNANLMKAFDKYIESDANLDEAFREFTKDAVAFDNFYETHLGVNAQDPELFNTLFEDYYHTHVHEVAKSAYDEAVIYKDYENNPADPDNDAKLEKKELYDLIMDYVYDYTDKLVVEYANDELEANHPELVDTIDELMHTELPGFIRNEYSKPDSEIKKTVDELIEKEGKKLINQYVSGGITDQKTLDFIDDTIKENIGVIVDGYIDGTLRDDIKQLVDDEIESYMNKLINDYINDVGDARDTLGELVPTYAQDAVDTLKATDAFKNTISDFTSGNGVRVNKDNIMFISILSELMAEYDYDKIMTDFAPAKVKTIADKVGKELASKYVNTLLDTFVDGIKEAEASLQADIDADIEGTEYRFTTTPGLRIYIMDDFVVDMYNKAIPKVAEKLNAIELIAVNPYAQKLINKNWITEFLDYDSTAVSEELSGYSIKKGEYDEEYDMTGSPIMTYYDIVLNNRILLHDAAMWYGDNYPQATVEDKLDAVSALMGTYANKANEAIMHYIETGELPKGYTPYELADKILEKVLGVNGKVDDAYGKLEDKYYENEDKILELVDKIKNFYAEKLNKDYTEVIDLADISVYADGKAYPVYKIILGISDENDAFNIDTLAEAIDDSDNYHGVNALEKGMNKIKSALGRFEDKNIASALRIIRNAYKVTVPSKEIKGFETGTHTVKLHRYFE